MDSHTISKNNSSKDMREQISSYGSLFKVKSFKEGHKLDKIEQYLILFDKKSHNSKVKKYQWEVMVLFSIWVWIWNSFLTNGVIMMDFVT